jgi:hypothetical protein
MFPNLRVVIEYDITNGITAGAGVVVSTTQPLLAADQILSDQLANKFLSEFKSVVWNALETESVYLPQGNSTDAIQKAVFKLNGFNDKTLQRLFIQKQGITTVSALYLNVGSEAMYDEAINLSVNGMNLLPESGVVSSNQKLALLSDTFGNMNIPLGGNLIGVLNMSELVDESADRVGHQDYFGVLVGAKIDSLQLMYQRALKDSTNTALNAYYSQALVLNCVGEVVKSIVKTKNGYQVLYL